MERSVLEEWGEIARVNLFQTYIDLAFGASGTKVEQMPRFVRVVGDPTVSFCNFVALFTGEADDEFEIALSQLTKWGEESASFWVYVTDFCKPAILRWRLVQNGFEARQTLTMMIWSGKMAPGGWVEPMEAKSTIERLSVTQFMTDIFFSRTSPAARSMVMESTTYSPHRVFAWNDRSGITGAVMLSTSPHVFGLYNLCVRADLRGHGLGRQEVDYVKALAAQEQRAVVLQCNPNLVDWYKDQGFEVLGTVDAYSMPERSWGGIV